MKRLTNRYASWMLAALAALLMTSLGAPAALAQADSEFECGDVDDSAKAMNYSLYWESHKNKDFASSMPYLRWVLNCSPEYPRNDDRNHERLREAYEMMAAEATDATVQRAYMDSVLMVFDTAPAQMEEAGLEYDPFEWTLEKGKYVQTNVEALDDVKDLAIESYREAYDMDGARLQPYYKRILIQDLVVNDDKEGAIDLMQEMEDAYGTDEGHADLMAFINQMRGSLFTNPVERMEFLEGQLDADPGNLEIITELFEIYRDLEERDKLFEMGEVLLSMNPTADTYRLLADLKLDDGETQEALDLYQQALDAGAADARDIYYNMGIAYQEMDRLSNARSMYRKALEVDPNFGRALMGIGDLYVSAVRNCGSMERDDRAVYWLATDYYNRAASRDEGVANTAQKKAAQIRPYYPTKESMFFKNWSNGQTITINYGCYSWIGESTTVRGA
ncbi:MAG: tetratricopeptide repeat protein [Bacteroidota bacterium]